MQDSTNVNYLPKHWQLIKLGDVCKTTSGGTPNRSQTKYYEGNIPWVKSGELDKGLITDTEEKITEEAIKNSSAKIFPKGTLLIALYGATIGKLGFLGVDAATNQAVCGIYKNENIDSNYLFHFLFFNKPSIIKQSIGGAQPNISQGILKNLDIPLPPVVEQKEIVAKIEELFSELDAGVGQLKTAQDQLKTYRQAVLKWAFEGIDKKITLQEISEAVGGCAFKSSDFKESGKYQVMRIGNIRPGIIRLGERPIFLNNIDEKIKEKYSLKTDDVVITLTGTRKKRDYGFTALVNVENLLLNQRLAYLRFNGKYLPKCFLYFSWTDTFKDQFFSNETGNVGQGNVGMGAIKNTTVPLPTIKEQEKIISEIETRLSVADEMKKVIEQTLLQAELLRQSILKCAFEGRLINS